MENTNTTAHTLPVSPHLLYALPLQDSRSFIEQAIENMEDLINEEEYPERIEPFSLDVLSILEQEEQESLERSIQKSTSQHWRTVPGLYKPIMSQDSIYNDEAEPYNLEDLSDYSDFSSNVSESQEDYGNIFQFYDGLEEAIGDFEDVSYKLTREVLGDRFAEMTRTLLKEMED